MTTTGHTPPAVARLHNAHTHPATRNRAFAVELVANEARNTRRAYIAARDADDFHMIHYHAGRADALAVILATIPEDGIYAARQAAQDIADHTADAPSDHLRAIGAHDAATESLMLDGTVVRVAPRGPWTASVMVFDAGGELSARASVSALGAADPAATILAVAAAMAGSAGNGRL